MAFVKVEAKGIYQIHYNETKYPGMPLQNRHCRVDLISNKKPYNALVTLHGGQRATVPVGNLFPAGRFGYQKDPEAPPIRAEWKPGNIWSGDRSGLACLTNPTELARKKGTVRFPYPVKVSGVLYADAEAAYQALKSSGQGRVTVMTQILEAKLMQHPQLFLQLRKCGGVNFLKRCSHRINGHNWWEGDGLRSPFLRCLAKAFSLVHNRWC